ncbi:hypothetical protein ACFSUS_00015 [Spirosoma soli]|uniref:AraC family transcriptional regulator n=1 Tax=Spirosoma soli TaxID=1770529 RepID=A0ABW5LXL7_9BACT
MPRIPQLIFVVPPSVHVLDLTGPVQVFYEAVDYGASYQLLYCSFQCPVTSSAGLNFGAVMGYQDVKAEPGDYVFLPGMAMEYIRSQEFKQETAFFDWLRQQHRKGTFSKTYKAQVVS